MNQELGNDRSLPVRYGDWVSGFITGDWGESALLNRPVRPLVLDRLGNSLVLGLFAPVAIVPFSIGFGVLAALHHGKALDRVISVTGLSLIAFPQFVAGGHPARGVRRQTRLVPRVVGGALRESGRRRAASCCCPRSRCMFVLFGYIAVDGGGAGTIDALQSNYTRTVVLKGLPQRTVVWRHVMRNAILPTIKRRQRSGRIPRRRPRRDRDAVQLPGHRWAGSSIRPRGHDLPVLEATVLVVAVDHRLRTSLPTCSTACSTRGSRPRLCAPIARTPPCSRCRDPPRTRHHCPSQAGLTRAPTVSRSRHGADPLEDLRRRRGPIVVF